MLIENTLFGTKDKVAEAIEVLQLMEPPEGYWVAFSGGKDSVTVKALCDMAKVKYEAHYSVTSVDPPELVRFIKDKYPDVSFDIPQDRNGKPITMWNLIPKEKAPPTRLMRYCCEELKESAGEGRLTVTGVRWAESSRRTKSQGHATSINTKGLDTDLGTKTAQGGIVLNMDNAESRELVESCYRHRNILLNPIIEWTDEEVWEFIHTYKVPYCELYDRGHKRLGCIGCPMGGAEGMKQQFAEYPKYEQAYLRAFKRMLDERNKNGLDTTKWDTPEAVMEWWLGDKTDKPIEGQIEMFEDKE